MKTVILKSGVVTLAASVLSGTLGGCCASPASSADIATTSVTVVNVLPFGSVKDNLKPKFTISGDLAKGEAIGITASQQTRSLNAVIGDVEAGIDVGSAGSAPAAPANQPTVTAAPAAITGSTLVTDASTVYSAADSLNQDVVLRNQAMDWVSGLDDKEFSAYIIRMSVSVLPITRDQPYDALADISFTPFGSVTGTQQVRVVPLLVTESFESIAQQQTSETMRSLALALSAQIGQAKLGGSIKAINDFIADLQARQLNGLMNVVRIGPNSVRVRLGAVASVRASDKDSLGYRMVPRDHKVSVLVVVPKATNTILLTSSLKYIGTDKGKPVYANSVERKDAIASVRTIFQKRLLPESFAKLDTPISAGGGGAIQLNRWDEILTARQEGNQIKFLALANGKQINEVESNIDITTNGHIQGINPAMRPFMVSKFVNPTTLPASQELRPAQVALPSATDAGTIWNELTDVIAKQSVQSELVTLIVNTPTAIPTAQPVPLTMLTDNGSAAAAKVTNAGTHLDPSNIRANLTFTLTPGSKEVSIPATSLSVGDHNTSLMIAFPSLQPILDSLKAVNGAGGSNQTIDLAALKLNVDFIDPPPGTENKFATTSLYYVFTKPNKDEVKTAASLSFTQSAVVRSADGASQPVDFTIVPTKDNTDAPDAQTKLRLKISGASSADIAATSRVANETSTFEIAISTTYRVTLYGTDPRTPVTFQVLKMGKDPKWKDASVVVATSLPVISH